MSDVAYRARLDAGLRRLPVLVVVVLAFTAVLHYSYKLKVAPLFAYQGLTYRAPDATHYGIAIGLVVLVAMALPRQIRHVSDFILWLFFTMAVAPAILVTQYNGLLTIDAASELGLHIAGCTLLVRALSAIRPGFGRLGRVHISPTSIWLIMGLVAGATYVTVIATAGLRLRFVDLAGGYDLREEFAAATAAATPLGYALPLVFGVINPAFMARGVYSGRWRWFAAGAAGQYVLFASTGQKSILFSIAGTLLISAMFRRSSRPDGLIVLGGIAVGALVTLGLDRILGGFLWTSNFVRRFMIVPGVLVAGYIATFDDQPKMGFATLYDGETPYSRPPTYLVGLMMTGNASTNANVSLFGDGYLQAGYLGMYVEGLVLVLLLWAADATTRGLPTAVASVVFFLPTIALGSGAIFTVIATHGFGAAIILCAALPRTGWGRPTASRPAPSGRLHETAVAH